MDERDGKTKWITEMGKEENSGEWVHNLHLDDGVRRGWAGWGWRVN